VGLYTSGRLFLMGVREAAVSLSPPRNSTGVSICKGSSFAMFRIFLKYGYLSPCHCFRTDNYTHGSPQKRAL
jgi:hypothetical protein